MPIAPTSDHHRPPKKPKRSLLAQIFRFFFWLFGAIFALVLTAFLGIAIALVAVYPSLPDVSELASDYRPKQPLRIYSADGLLIGEFGEERRQLVPIDQIPKDLTQAVLAIEDTRFFEHGGIDYIGVARAAVANLGGLRRQGASTITMQVARNVYLTSEKTFTRKIYEALLTLKLEKTLGKKQILEIYMNQIFLGHRSYGFAAASEVYFHKPLQELTLAESAMLAGLPQAPSAHNPISNLARAKKRQEQVLDRMLEVGFITPTQAAQAKAEVITPKRRASVQATGMQYVVETARQLICTQYGDECYTRGMNVYTTVDSKEQAHAHRVLRKALLRFDARRAWRGPESFIQLPDDADGAEQAVDAAFEDLRPQDDFLPAIVLQAQSNKITAILANGSLIELGPNQFARGAAGLRKDSPAQLRIVRGAVLRVQAGSKEGDWNLVQTPEVEGALISLNPHTGAIRSMVGGFDFNKSNFNHVTQAERQPGSTFKPFIYSAALEHGFTPTSVISDGPLSFSAAETGGKPWTPKNYGGGYGGPTTMRSALARSRNLVSIRILRSIGAYEGQQWAGRFGFPPEKNPPHLTLALGAGSSTPMQMAVAYAVFANGGHRINPWLIRQVTDTRNQVLVATQPPVLDNSNLVIDPRNAFVMSSMLQDVTTRGTAAAAAKQLKRTDIYGKTGTTNDAKDAWFAGWHDSLVAAVWIGYDTPRSLGSNETGGGLALPVWIEYMQPILSAVPESPAPQAPEGLVRSGNNWYYIEYPQGGGVRSVDVRVRAPTPRPKTTPDLSYFDAEGGQTTAPPVVEESSPRFEMSSE